MESYEEKVKKIKELINETSKKRVFLGAEEAKLHKLLEKLELEEIERNSGLTKKELEEVKKSITVIGNMLSDSNVIFGNLQILNEDPDETEGGYRGNKMLKFSIKIECNFVSDFAMGLDYSVTIKTKNKTIVQIINSMITTNEPEYEDYESDEEDNIKVKESKLKTSWSANWDYHRRFILKS